MRKLKNAKKAKQKNKLESVLEINTEKLNKIRKKKMNCK